MFILTGCNRPPANPAGAQAPARRGGVPVRVAKAIAQDVPLELRAIGNVEAYASVAVKSRVAGQIEKVFFTDGQDLKEGDVLFQLDSAPFEEQVRLAEANIARDRAAEKQAQASALRDEAVLKNARMQADRQESLMKQGIVAKETAEQLRTAADAAEAALAANRAAIDSARAALKADEVRLAQAKLELGYTTIRAPIGGRAGFISVKEGNLIKENDAVALVVIHRVQPAYVTFAVPEQMLPDIRKHLAVGPLVVETVDETRDKAIATGRLASFDNTVDASTGTIKLKATSANADRALWPGQYVNVRLRLRVDRAVLTVPSKAVQNGLNGPFAWVVLPGGTVEDRLLKVVRTHGDLTVLAAGVQADETVVTEGHLRLRKGERAEILDKP